MEAALSERVLVLNRGWAAVNVATVRRALTLVFQNAARIVEPLGYATYDFHGWIEASRSARGGPCIRSAHFELRIPEVIVLLTYTGRHLREVRCTRRNVFERDGLCCQYCGRSREAAALTLDHVIPRSRGGMSTWENVVTACFTCNSRKGNRLPAEAGLRLLSKPVKPDWAGRMGVRLGRVRRDSWAQFLGEAAGE